MLTSFFLRLAAVIWLGTLAGGAEFPQALQTKVESANRRLAEFENHHKKSLNQFETALKQRLKGVNREEYQKSREKFHAAFKIDRENFHKALDAVQDTIGAYEKQKSGMSQAQQETYFNWLKGVCSRYCSSPPPPGGMLQVRQALKKCGTIP